jgi:peptidoglycan/LPS O-acetylase OafA/YrhL
LFFLNRSARYDLLAFAAVAVVILAWRYVLAANHLVGWEVIYHNTDTRLDAPLFGVILALTMWSRPRSAVAAFVKSEIGLACGVALMASSLALGDELFRMTLRYTVQGVGIALVVGYLVFSQRRLATLVRSVLDARALRFIGQISYPLYLWHLTLLMFVVHVYPKLPPLGAVLIGAISFGLACASYFWIERPFLGLRRRYGSHSTI